MPQKPPAPGDDSGTHDDPPRRTPGDHWKKLLRSPMPPRRVTVEVFVAELNRRLRADAGYREGTRFIVAGNDDSRPGAATWEGPEAMKPLVVRIVQGAVAEFEVDQPFFSDR